MLWLVSIVALLVVVGLGLALLFVVLRLFSKKAADAPEVDAFGDPIPTRAEPLADRAPVKPVVVREHAAVPAPVPMPVPVRESVAVPEPVAPLAVAEVTPPGRLVAAAPRAVASPPLVATPTLVVDPEYAEPIAAAPIAVEPVAAEPVAAEPVVEPVAEPVAAPIAAAPIAAEPVAAPIAAEPVAAEPVATPTAPDAPVFTSLEKLRVADLGLILRVNATRLGGQELLAFTTEGFAARGRPEIVVYAPRSMCPDADLVRSLKRFAALALVLLERPAPVQLGELVRIPGEIGSLHFGGYLVVEPNEPVAVPMGEHVVLIGVHRRHLAADEAEARATLLGQPGGVPYVTAAEPIAE